jgi:hypothetical protein
MIFCDTTGLHRGGFAETRPRALATLAYTSPASLAALTRRNYTLAANGLTSKLDAPARYALSWKGDQPPASEWGSHSRARRPQLAAAFFAVLALVVTLFVWLPEVLGDKPYNVF